MADPQEDYLELSDEDFAKLSGPSVVEQDYSKEHEETPGESEDSSQEAVESEEALETDPGTETTEPEEEIDSPSGLGSPASPLS